MDSKLISEAISKTELLDIYLSSSVINRDINFDYDFPLDNVVQQSKLGLDAQMLESPDDDSVILRALITFGVRFIPKPHTDEVGTDIDFFSEIEAVFCALYRLKPDLSDDAIREFLQHNAVHNVWPFWREHALRVSAEAKLPRPVISLMKPANH